MNERQLQEKIMTYRILESRFEALVKQRDFIVNKIIEIQSTLSGIDEIEKCDEEILFPIGSEAYTSGKVTNKKELIVEIGANVALKKTVDEGKGILNKRKDELESTLEKIQKNISDVSMVMDQLRQEIDELNQEQQAG